MDLLDLIRAGKRCSIIILDICMPLISGMELAQEIRKYDRVAKIIFLTTSERFALASYDVRAYGYVVKDGTFAKLYRILNEAVGEISSALDEYTLIKTKTGLVKIFYHSVEYIEIMGKMISIHLKNGEAYEKYGTLSDIENTFTVQPHFIKPHRSFIVNMNYIRKLHNNEIIMVSGARVPVAKSSYGELKAAYISYSFKRGESDG